MSVEKIHLYIAIFAGMIMTLVNIFLHASLLDVCTRLVITLILFYIVGYIAEGYIRKKIIKKPEEQNEKTDEEDDPEPTLTGDESQNDENQ